jgi:UDP:flavonoid glycosyltransferase YjiC (YdhE family)
MAEYTFFNFPTYGQVNPMLAVVQELGLGIALDEAAVTADALRKAVSRIVRDPGFKKRLQAMQQNVREAGGYQRAANALQDYL